jgi:hypothetical protein
MFAAGGRNLYGLSPDGSAVFRNAGVPMEWTKIGGPAGAIYASRGCLLATNPKSHDLWLHEP